MKHWIISSKESGIKLIDFLKQKIGLECSARHLKRLIENKCCQVNGRTERFASAVLGAGDEVQFQSEESLKSPKIALTDPVRFLYEDADLFIYDKPAGIASDHLLLSNLKPSLELIHRLDKETSGVLMFAKTSKMKEAMIKEFQHKNIKKTYVALVYGVPGKKKGVIDNYLGKIAQYQGQSIWGSVSAEAGLHARTEWELIKKGKEAAMLYCMPITGRTHQIRVHLSDIGHPILGDHAYGNKVKSSYQAPRCCLHALSISFTHPFTNEPLHVEAEIPEDMQSIIQQLQKSG
jgi:RluA family pseudouridine synthase